MQWKTRPLGYFSYTVLCCLCKRGDGRAAREGGEHHLFQFTPLREGRPRCGVVCCQILQISIHAPARGATMRRRPRSAWRYFNSRPCERGDAYESGYMAGRLISIHAPARGATGPARRSRPNPLFQFTPLREGRPGRPRFRRWGLYFNSRPCERGDVDLLCALGSVCEISIHAPARGATSGGSHHLVGTANFNSRPCERGDLRRQPPPGRHSQFQFTPLREGRPVLRDLMCSSWLFQFTPLREGRRQGH